VTNNGPVHTQLFPGGSTSWRYVHSFVGGVSNGPDTKWGGIGAPHGGRWWIWTLARFGRFYTRSGGEHRGSSSFGICTAATCFRVHGYMERRCDVLFLATACSQRLPHLHVGLMRPWANVISHLWNFSRDSGNPDASPIHRQQARPLPVRALVARAHRAQRAAASGGSQLKSQILPCRSECSASPAATAKS